MSRNTEYAQRALEANDEFFSVDELEDAENGSFTSILAQLESQREVYRNREDPVQAGESPDGTRMLYPSQTGYETLFGGLRPRMLYIPEGDGARERPQDAVVDQVVLHSFGYAIDKTALRSGARSIQVDDAQRGHNPYKVAQRMQQVLFQSGQSTTHLISRRGDIISATPWNRGPAVNSTGQARSLGVPLRSISIELESWYTSARVPFRGTREADFKVLGLEPYTPEQLSALSFLLKKLGVWSNTRPVAPLGYTFSDVREKLGTSGGHAPGIVNVSVLNAQRKAEPGAEFEFPIAWGIGDPLPPHLDPTLWERRVQLYYSGLAEGTRISHFATVENAYDALPEYSFASELFEDQPANLFSERPPDQGGQNAAAQEAINARGNGYARSQRLQGRSRANQYDAAAVSTDATIQTTAAYATRQAQTAATQVATPIIRNALAFDFATGQWVIATSRLDAPVLPTARTPQPATPAAN